MAWQVAADRGRLTPMPIRQRLADSCWCRRARRPSTSRRHARVWPRRCCEMRRRVRAQTLRPVDAATRPGRGPHGRPDGVGRVAHAGETSGRPKGGKDWDTESRVLRRAGRARRRDRRGLAARREREARSGPARRRLDARRTARDAAGHGRAGRYARKLRARRDRLRAASASTSQPPRASSTATPARAEPPRHTALGTAGDSRIMQFTVKYGSEARQPPSARDLDPRRGHSCFQGSHFAGQPPVTNAALAIGTDAATTRRHDDTTTRRKTSRVRSPPCGFAMPPL